MKPLNNLRANCCHNCQTLVVEDKQELYVLTNKSVKENCIFDLIFSDFHMGCQKEPKSDFQSLFFFH